MRLQRSSRDFNVIPRDFNGFHGIPRDSMGGTSRDSARLQHDSKGFQWVLWDSVGLSGTPRDFKEIPRDFHGFHGTPWESERLHRDSAEFQRVPWSPLFPPWIFG